MGPERRFFSVVLLILAYEWLISGLDKLLSGHFITGLHQELSQKIASGLQYQFYEGFLQRLCLPHSMLIGGLVEVGELLIGLVFAVAGIMLLVSKPSRRLGLIGTVISIIAAFLCLNFFFYQGGAFFVNPSDPFDEGIPIDLLMVFLQLAVAAGFWRVSQSILTSENTNRSGSGSRD